MTDLSIIVPLYNHENEVTACIDSLLRTVDDRMMIVIIDDGSTDNGYRVVNERYKDNRQIKILHKENGGLSDTRNFGMGIVESEFVTFCDPDDTVDDKYCYRRLIDKMNRYELDYLLFNFNIDYKADNKRVPNNRFPDEDILLQGEADIRGLQAATLVGSINQLGIPFLDGGQYTWSKIYRTSIIRKNGLHFSKELTYAEDSIFNYYYLNFVERALITNERLYNYAVYEENATNRYKKDIAETYDKYRDYIIHLEKEENELLHEVYNARIYRNLINILRFNVYHKDNPERGQTIKDILRRYPYYEFSIRELKYRSVSGRQQILLFLLKHRLYFLLRIAFRFS